MAFHTKFNIYQQKLKALTMIKTLYNIGKLLIVKEPDWFKPWEYPFAGTDESEKIVIVINIVNKKILSR